MHDLRGSGRNAAQGASLKSARCSAAAGPVPALPGARPGQTGREHQPRGLLRPAATRTAAEGRLHRQQPRNCSPSDAVASSYAADIIERGGHSCRARHAPAHVSARSGGRIRARPHRLDGRADDRSCSALTVLGGALRFGTLNVQSIWLDESATLILVHRGFSGMLSHLVLQRVHPAPVLRPRVGAGRRSSAPARSAFGSLSALVGTLTIPVAVRRGQADLHRASACGRPRWRRSIPRCTTTPRRRARTRC